jgi:hypothetical protein
MRKIIYITLLVILAHSSYLSGESIIQNEGVFLFGLDFQHLYHYNPYSKIHEDRFVLPAWIRMIRQEYPLIKGRNKKMRDVLSDNPLYHGASYFDFYMHYNLSKNISIQTHLFAEHRGISYGIFSTSAMVVYPMFRGELKKTFSFMNSQWDFDAILGCFADLRLYEGLNFFNLDTQGTNISLRKGHLKASFFLAGDLINGIGLNIDDLIDYSIAYYSDDHRGSFQYQIQVGVSDVGRKFKRYIWNLAASILSPKRFSLYTQISYKKKKDFFQWETSHPSIADMCGALLGFKYNLETIETHFLFTFEIRYFGKYFNAGNCDHNVVYRKEYGGEYNNTVGPNLYPLRWFNRPFLQWAVFTEYQSKNIAGVTSVISFKKQLLMDLFVRADIDFNYLFTEGEPSFLYPFYDLGLAWRFFKLGEIKVSLTNKSMNLDIYYPSFYLLRDPYILIDIGCSI